jgi:ABC-2 type transport system permease protein
MKRYLGFIKKEFLHIFRDYRTMVILFGLPIVQLMIFGFVISNEIKDGKIAILDQSRDEVTKQITSKILSSGYFKLVSYLDTPSQIESEFRKGTIKEVIVYEPGFGKHLERDKTAHIQVIADASDPNVANLLVNYTSGIVRDYVNQQNSSAIAPMQIVPEIRMLYNEGLKSVFMFVPGTMAMILMLVSAMMTSISIAREKEFGSLEVLLVSPLKPIQIILGKVAPYVTLSFINAITILLLSYFVFGLPVKGSLVLLLGESILFIFVALSLGILISTVSPNQQIAMFMSMFLLMLPTILLSGFIFPIANMPKILQWISFIMPPRWFIVIIKDIMLKGTGFIYVWKETLYLFLFTIFFIMMSVRKFKIRLE